MAAHAAQHPSKVHITMFLVKNEKLTQENMCPHQVYIFTGLYDITVFGMINN